MGHLGRALIFVRAVREDRQLLEVMQWRRRCRLPFETSRAPGVPAGRSSILQCQCQIDEDDHESEKKQGGSRLRRDVERLKTRRVLIVPARHSHVSEQKLRNKCRVETENDQRRRYQPPSFSVST